MRRDAIEQSLQPLGRPPAWLAAATPGAAPAAEPPAWRAPAVLAMAGWALAGVTGHVRAGGALERRLVGDLGMPPADAQVLLDRARGRLGGRAYARRALAAVIAANAVARRLLPADVRRRAIMPLAVSLLATQADGLAYVGLLDIADEPLETRGMLPRSATARPTSWSSARAYAGCSSRARPSQTLASRSRSSSAAPRRSHAEQLRTGEHAGPGAQPNHEIHPHARPYPWTYVYGVGGSTLAWAGVTPRFAEDDFRLHAAYGVGRDWPFGLEELAPYYEAAELALGVAGRTGPARRTRSPPSTS